MRKVRVGSVVGTRMDKTAVVELVWKQRHRVYRKQMRRVTRFYVHDPEEQCQIGDMVRIQETRPISRTKHWRLLNILSRREVADIRPIELEGDSIIETSEDPSVASDSAIAVAQESGDYNEDEDA
ncbi:30S ribosomal protein S17 [Geodia barretti]|uniref:Small ribosomal subunit protein uS17 n=1 Tax=Geodia barretti TaxID=519541 RepID=A0AA35RJ16_GEOBA|nr:30S ribosomal protein S17 [Geodia barretti]